MFVCVRVRACVCVKEREEKRRTACMGLENLHFPRSPQKKEEGEKKKQTAGRTVAQSSGQLCACACLCAWGQQKQTQPKQDERKKRKKGRRKKGKQRGKKGGCC